MIKNILFTLTHPNYWIINGRYSKHLDSWILENIKIDPKFEAVDDYRATLNGKEFWIANYPYGFSLDNMGTRPSRLTISKFYDALDRSQIYEL
jgi:hypothetical protein